MKTLLAARTRIAPSATLAVSDAVRRLRAQGIEVVDLGGGDPDFATPAHIVEAAVAAMQRGDTHYVESTGVPALRAAIAAKLRRENRLEVKAEEILVTPGGKAALFAAIQALVEPGVDVLVPEPAWVSYRPMVEAAGGGYRPVPLDADAGFALTRAALEAALTPATRLLIINSPCNPTGRVLRAEELEAVAAFARERDVIVLSDEIYEHLVYDSHQHRSLASLPGLAERTLTVNGFSKAWAMTGWRLGYLAGPAALLAGPKLLHGHMVTCAASFAQAGALAALEGSLEPVRTMVARWDQRRRTLVEGLNTIPGLRCALPEGAFYAWVDIRGSGLDSITFARQLIEQARVAVTPGEAFGEAGAGHVRLSYATSDSALEFAVTRLGAFMANRGTNKDL